jgi:putative ABC transport system ATP-binding protein
MLSVTITTILNTLSIKRSEIADMRRTMNTILEAKSLDKEYGSSQKTQILKNVNLKIAEREFVPVMGPSGSGKSTLLYNISGMDQMTAGGVVLDGEELSSLMKMNWPKSACVKWGLFFSRFIY